MSEISSCDKILHIGCGAIPYTLIIIYKELNVNVTGIDIKDAAVNQAKNFLKKINLSKVVKIKKGNGMKHNISKYDFIVISYGVKDIDKVVKHVLLNSKEDAKILLRKPTIETIDGLESILNKYSIKRKRLLLTQESILIDKKHIVV